MNLPCGGSPERYLQRKPILFTTNKPLAAWGHVLHDPDLAEAILDRVLERGRHIQLRGPSYRTRHHQRKEKNSGQSPEAPGAIFSGNLMPEFPESTFLDTATVVFAIRVLTWAMSPPSERSRLRRIRVAVMVVALAGLAMSLVFSVTDVVPNPSVSSGRGWLNLSYILRLPATVCAAFLTIPSSLETDQIGFPS